MWTLATLVLVVSAASAGNLAEDDYHPDAGGYRVADNVNDDELDAAHWSREAQDALEARAHSVRRGGFAKNVVFFLGDGMSVPTLAAARTMLGQLSDRPGEESQLSFEKFPVVGLSKTYCVDDQVADSACSATAYLCGAKANRGTIGVTARVGRGNCTASLDESTRVRSVAEWAVRAGKDVGVVTTTRITHASPAGAFAHVAHRDWESAAPVGCADIAHQLIHGRPGKEFKVILGGGRSNFKTDGGSREDGRDLTEEWLEDKDERNVSHAYVEDARQLRDVDLDRTDYLLGLFSESHAPYHNDRDPDADPSLSELTTAAVRVLRRNEKGFFLFVEGGRIDHAHHSNRARLALYETIEFAAAVEETVDLEDTLLVVTADHSHVMAFNGYSPRGQDVLGRASQTDRDGVPYMILSYTNGPGFRKHAGEGLRADPTAESTFGQPSWRAHADVPLGSETHGGEDVPVFARGPQQHLFTGLYEQSQLPHLVGYAACIGPGLHAPECNAAPSLMVAPLLMILSLIVLI